MLLHDEHGHPLLATTHRGDQHLTVGLPNTIARYEHDQEHIQVKRIIVDREGMATEFLVSMHAEGRTVVTILHTNQYQNLTSFCDVGAFLPLSLTPKVSSYEKWPLLALPCRVPTIQVSSFACR